MSVLVNGTALNDLNYTGRLTSNGTTVLTGQDCYVSSIAYTVEVAGTAGNTLTISDNSGTPRVLVNGVSTTSASGNPTVLTFAYPGIKMLGGLKATLANGTPATVNLWVQGVQ